METKTSSETRHTSVGNGIMSACLCRDIRVEDHVLLEGRLGGHPKAALRDADTISAPRRSASEHSGRKSEETHTLSPFANAVTPALSSSTVPAASFPMRAGYVSMKRPNACIFQSSGFNAVAATLTRICPGPGVGTEALCTSNGPYFFVR